MKKIINVLMSLFTFWDTNYLVVWTFDGIYYFSYIIVIFGAIFSVFMVDYSRPVILSSMSEILFSV